MHQDTAELRRLGMHWIYCANYESYFEIPRTLCHLKQGAVCKLVRKEHVWSNKHFDVMLAKYVKKMWNCCTVLWMPRSIKILRQGSFRTWCTKGWHLIGSTWDTWPNSEVSRCYSKTMQDLFVITLVPCSDSASSAGWKRIFLDAFLLNLDIYIYYIYYNIIILYIYTHILYIYGSFLIITSRKPVNKPQFFPCFQHPTMPGLHGAWPNCEQLPNADWGREERGNWQCVVRIVHGIAPLAGTPWHAPGRLIRDDTCMYRTLCSSECPCWLLNTHCSYNLVWLISCFSYLFVYQMTERMFFDAKCLKFGAILWPRWFAGQTKSLSRSLSSHCCSAAVTENFHDWCAFQLRFCRKNWDRAGSSPNALKDDATRILFDGHEERLDRFSQAGHLTPPFQLGTSTPDVSTTTSKLHQAQSCHYTQ